MLTNRGSSPYARLWQLVPLGARNSRCLRCRIEVHCFMLYIRSCTSCVAFGTEVQVATTEYLHILVEVVESCSLKLVTCVLLQYRMGILKMV